MNWALIIAEANVKLSRLLEATERSGAACSTSAQVSLASPHVAVRNLYPHQTSCEGLPKEIPYIITYDDPRLVILAIANEGFGRS